MALGDKRKRGGEALWVKVIRELAFGLDELVHFGASDARDDLFGELEVFGFAKRGFMSARSQSQGNLIVLRRIFVETILMRDGLPVLLLVTLVCSHRLEGSRASDQLMT